MSLLFCSYSNFVVDIDVTFIARPGTTAITDDSTLQAMLGELQ